MPRIREPEVPPSRGRAPLSTDLERYYEEAYENVSASGAFRFFSKLQHRSLERGKLLPRSDGLRIIEVGAGSGQHIRYLQREGWSQYTQTDLRPPSAQVALTKQGDWVQDSVDASRLPFDDHSFDRLIATCVLAHTVDPGRALEEWRRVVRPGGVLTVYLPTEPSLSISASRVLSSSRSRIRLGFDPRIVLLDHRFNYRYLSTLIDVMFKDCAVEVRRFPQFLPYWLALWEVVHIRLPQS